MSAKLANNALTTLEDVKIMLGIARTTWMSSETPCS